MYWVVLVWKTEHEASTQFVYWALLCGNENTNGVHNLCTGRFCVEIETGSAAIRPVRSGRLEMIWNRYLKLSCDICCIVPGPIDDFEAA